MGTIGQIGAYRAMSDGYVDETWAKEHHLYWYNDIKAGKIPTADDARGAAKAAKPAPPIVPNPR
jgi:formate dehydrogenase subunit gamma